MLRGCLLSLGLYATLAVGYFFWLDTAFERPTSFWASALVAFMVLCCIGALMNARNAFRDWRMVSRGLRGLAPRDGQLIAVSGTIHPVGQPLVAPFSGIDCVLCEYDLSRPWRKTPKSEGNPGSDFAGFLMTPCVIRGPGGDIKLLGFPVLDGFGDEVFISYTSARRALDFLTTREFENRTGMRAVTVLGVFDEVWSDEDGHVEKNIRLGKISLPDLFPPELEAQIDRQLELEHSEEEMQADSDDEAFDDDEDGDADVIDDDDDYASGPEVPRMKEKRVDVGEEVCAIGRYNELRGGLLPAKGSTTPNRILRGSAEKVAARSRGSIVSYLIGGLVGLAVVHAGTYGVMQAYLRSPEMVRFRQKEAFEAISKPDMARLERLHRRGMDINVRNHGGGTLLMSAPDARVAAWLIEHGADVNAANEKGETALMMAAQSGRTEIVKQLIDAKADLNRRSTDFHRTALMAAVDAGKADVAALLRKAGAEDDVITAESGQPLPEGGGPQLAVCLAYLKAVGDRDPAALRALFVTSSTYGFESVDWDLWLRVRPAQIESWTGFVRGDDATLSLTGTSGGYQVTWVYQLRLTDGQWKIARERQDYGVGE